MAGYVDGFVIPVPKRNVRAYVAMAKKASKVWMDHGALQYFECVGEDLTVPPGCGLSYPKGIRAKPGEAIVFAFVVYKSRKHRDAVNAKIMADPRIAAMMNGKKMPFDVKRMMYGGFKVAVEG